MKFYEICVQDDHIQYSVIATCDGQILSTDLSYHSGLAGHTVFDPAVKTPADWFGCQISRGSLYYTTTDFIQENLSKSGDEVTVKEVSFDLPYKKVIPHKGMIGDRRIIKPQNILIVDYATH